ncbi:hypothetical protein [Rhizobium tubonense]|uniref:hypothetical protein n=1 Tax=Rhizobium tubonense TaxID=484088 RepID=UPI001FCE66B2|nr:hypothetical protein [Rhizobium tubonense]
MVSVRRGSSDGERHGDVAASIIQRNQAGLGRLGRPALSRRQLATSQPDRKPDPRTINAAALLQKNGSHIVEEANDPTRQAASRNAAATMPTRDASVESCRA